MTRHPIVKETNSSHKKVIHIRSSVNVFEGPVIQQVNIMSFSSTSEDPKLMAWPSNKNHNVD